ncbi:globin domain-containing protein [uncultured Roseobacter sp.]|uniref:globin domain-containing protein n=1 Tax=uncultured Roseobacter sp. TaxID=114847 RepID=UPI0026390FDC|nr:globin domain-containing protein [uncultured Roseobacter sp.]
MDLNQDDIDAIRASYMQLSSDLQHAGDIFYEALFEIAPETRNLFLADMSAQSMKLMSTLGLVVSQLQNSDELEPVVRDLALRHLAYGVEEKHYEQVREALMKMLTVLLDHEGAAAAQAAWARAYDALAGVMVKVAYPERRSGISALVD